MGKNRKLDEEGPTFQEKWRKLHTHVEVKPFSAHLVSMPIPGRPHSFKYLPGSAGVKAVTSGS